MRARQTNKQGLTNVIRCMTMRCMTILDAVVFVGLLVIQPKEKRAKVFVQLLALQLAVLGVKAWLL